MTRGLLFTITGNKLLTELQVRIILPDTLNQIFGINNKSYLSSYE